jgi:ATP-dependent Lon protease
MRDYRDAKVMAQTLRHALKEKSVSLTHSECLELVAKTLGFHDWHVLAATIKSGQPAFPLPNSSLTSRRYSDVPPVGVIPVLPMRDLVLFPRMVAPLFVGRDKSKRALQRASDGGILVITQRRSADDHPTANDLHVVGVTARVTKSLALPDGTLKLLVTGSKRAAVVRLIEGKFLAAEAAPIEQQRGRTADAFALMRAVLDAYRTYANVNLSSSAQAVIAPPHIPQAVITPPPVSEPDKLADIREPGLLADAVAPLLSIGIARKQQILEITDVVTRLETILDVMKTGRDAT